MSCLSPYRSTGWVGVLFVAMVALGCAVPVAAGLDESDANRILVALDRVNIEASKEIDPGVEGKFRVLVARDDAASALTAMQGEELPRPRPRGVLDAVDKGALVPSQAAEHAQLVAGLAGDLERTLEGVDGVLAARVHINLSAKDPLRDTAGSKATASVLLAHRGSSPPITVDSVQRLVAGGVAGLSPFDVAVVTVPRPAPPAPSMEGALAHVGPIAVAQSSMRALKVALIGLCLVVAALASATLALYTRLARMRAERDAKA